MKTLNRHEPAERATKSAGPSTSSPVAKAVLSARPAAASAAPAKRVFTNRAVNAGVESRLHPGNDRFCGPAGCGRKPANRQPERTCRSPSGRTDRDGGCLHGTRWGESRRQHGRRLGGDRPAEGALGLKIEAGTPPSAGVILECDRPKTEKEKQSEKHAEQGVPGGQSAGTNIVVQPPGLGRRRLRREGPTPLKGVCV